MANAKSIVDQVWKIIENKRLDQLFEIIAPDCTFKMPGAPELRGVEGLKQLLTAYLAAFPDLRHEVKRFVESGDSIALELDVTGTHTGPMHTEKGVVPATGKRVTWESCDCVQVKGGKIVSWHVYHDTLPFLTALGLM